MRERGFTLIEILIAVFILGIVLTPVYVSYTGTFRIIADTKTDAELYGMARAALGRMIRDMRAVSPWRGSFFFVAKPYILQNQAFTSLAFRSVAHVAFGKNEPAAGVALIEYTVEEGGEGKGFALYRSDSLSQDLGEDGPSPRKYLLCDRIASLAYVFYDDKGGGYERWDSGGGEEKQKKKVPAIVEIRMSLTSDKKPKGDVRNPDYSYPFMTRVYIPVTAAR